MSPFDDVPLAEIERLSQVAVSEDEIAFLIACLGQSRKAVQRRAAEALAAAANRGVPVAEALQHALDDATPARRWGAAYTLSLIGTPPPAVLPILVEVLGSPDGDLRWAAADIVKRLGPIVTSHLLRLARDGHAPQRKMALYCLRDLRVTGEEGAAAVCAGLKDSDPGVRLAALAALPHLGLNGATATDWGLSLVNDGDAGVRRAAIATLGSLGHRTPKVDEIVLRAARNADDPGSQRAAARAMKLLGITHSSGRGGPSSD